MPSYRRYTRKELQERAEQVCFFDLETTTVSEDGTRQITEFACMVMQLNDLSLVGEWETLIKPRGANSPSKPGITKFMLESAPSFKDEAQEIKALMHNRIWCGHNIKAFDIPFLQKSFEKARIKPPVPFAIVDSLDVVKSYYDRKAKVPETNKVGSNKLRDLCIHFDIGRQTHRALSDCDHTIKMLKCLSVELWSQDDHPIVFGNEPFKKAGRTRSNVEDQKRKALALLLSHRISLLSKTSRDKEIKSKTSGDKEIEAMTATLSRVSIGERKCRI